MYYVYILRSEKDSRFYTGLTKDISRRLREHNSGNVRSTKNRIPFELVYKEEFVNRTKARIREKFFKSGSGREFRDNNIPR